MYSFRMIYVYRKGVNIGRTTQWTDNYGIGLGTLIVRLVDNDD
jgi:hypothetical protein